MEESVEDIVHKWLSQHKEGSLNNRSFRDYWRRTVPLIYAPQPNFNPMHIEEQEEQSTKLLTDPLHQFIAGSSTPDKVYNSIRELDAAPALCGYVFNAGEPTYGCRDCGFDPTCVLCSDCFKASPHTKHRYKMSTSSGGGYCDCGDTEAWRSDAFCSVHAKGTQGICMSSHKQLDPDLVSRIQIVMECIIDYVRDMLTLSEGLSLPSDLELPDAEPTRNPNLYKMMDVYCAVLYNDESHTYDQVIAALERAIKCTKKEAVTFVTFIDREGRCVIRCSGFQACQQVKSAMDRMAISQASKPFIVKIFRSHIQAHQSFASQLLVWLDKLLEKGNAIKAIFSEVIFSCPSGDNMTMLERIMWTDNELCKATRIQWHKLFISGLLMDFETKKRFARLFTKHYSKMMKTFIADDHEHSVCIVSLGVQLFTMPTIAHMLIAEEAVIAKLILTFITECTTRIKNGKLFPLSQNANLSNLEQGSMTPTEFRRVQFILFDLKYLLGMTPLTWTDQLRKGFLHGFNQIIKLFCMMQNMDPVTRKEGSHVEFEQEWEGSFNLHIKMSPILPQIVDWASSDRVVLIKAMRMLLKALNEHGCEGLQKRFMREAAGHTVCCIEYDVSKSPVSMHIVLTRLCGSLAVQLQRYDLSYNSPEFPTKDKPSLKEFIEPSLRTLVMVSQCKAGMWRRNGMALTNQTYFYRNVRCRQEMMDKDVLVLQNAAALMPPDDFLISLLNRFNLMSWQRPDYETTYLWSRDDDNIRQTVVILEEFCQLLLYIVAERYVVGVAQVEASDVTKHEVIHLLCVQNMTHSSINKQLPEGTNHETGMEQIIDDIADFKKASGEVKGYYELKTKFYDMYNIFFYHYSKEEQSKSEVEHRERCKKLGREVCCPPPPVPPFTPAFAPIRNLFNCAVFRHLLHEVFSRWSDERSKSVTETSVQVCLHLLGVACYEELHTPGFLTNPGELRQVLQLLQANNSTASLLSLIAWTRRKLEEAFPEKEKPAGSVDVAADSVTSIADAAVNPAADTEELDEKQRKAKASQERKQKILNKMAKMQKNFVKSHKALFSEESTVEDRPSESEVEQMEVCDLMPDEMVALGPKQTLPHSTSFSQTCIVCHMDESMCQGAAGSDESKNLLVVGVMVQPSTVLARRRREFNTLDQPLYLPADLHRGIHVSSCGHPMHVHCWKLYYIKVIQKEQRRNYRMRQGTNIDVERSEYLCPLCECICNDAVPLLPPPTQPLFGGSITQGDILVTPQQWLHGLHVIHTNKVARTVHASAPELSDSLSDEEDSTAVAGVWLPPDLPSVTSRLTSDMNSSCAASNFLKMFTSEYNTTMSNLLPTSDQVMWDFAHSIFRHGLDQNPNLADERILGCTLASLAYTIRSHEEVQRYEGRALLTGISSRQHLFLSSLTATAAYIPSNQCSKQMPQVSTSAAVCVLRDVLGASSVTLLEMDCFSAAVSLVLLLPGIFSPTHATAKGGLQDQYVLQLCFLGHIVQLLLTYDRTFPEDQTPMEDTDEVQEAVLGSWVAAEEEDPMDKECEDSSGSEHDASWLLALFHQSRDAVGLPPLHVNAATLLAHIKERCLPFLRCAGLFFHLLTGCAAPAELSSSVWVPESEYYCLLRYLGLPTSLAQSLQPFASVVKVWLAHPRLLKCLKVPTFDGDRALTVNKLYPLLKDYSEFISEVASFACPSSTVGEKSSTPTICLVCGTMMCSQTYCCQTELPDATKQMVGATTAHAHTCCAGSGMFLRVWDCTVIFRTGKYKGCYFTPPYLDQYGEADMGLRRGNPLFLNAESYSRLHAKWLQHLIPETVSRTLAAASTHVFSIDWQHV